LYTEYEPWGFQKNRRATKAAPPCALYILFLILGCL
jgi:hypothetical protein